MIFFFSQFNIRFEINKYRLFSAESFQEIFYTMFRVNGLEPEGNKEIKLKFSTRKKKRFRKKIIIVCPKIAFMSFSEKSQKIIIGKRVHIMDEYLNANDIDMIITIN
jgi:hypothetical protein